MKAQIMKAQMQIKMVKNLLLIYLHLQLILILLIIQFQYLCHKEIIHGLLFAIQGASWDQISQFNPVVTVSEQTVNPPEPEGDGCFNWTDQGGPGIPRAESLDDFMTAYSYCYYIMNSSIPGSSSIGINWSLDSWSTKPDNISLPDLGVNPYNQQSPNSPIASPFFCIIIGNDVVGLIQNPNGNGGAIWNTYNYIPEGGGC